MMFNWTIFPETSALIIGRKYGKNNFSYFISPNKTWEGFIGQMGFLPFGLLTLYGHAYFRPDIVPSTPVWYQLVFGILATLCCIFGDLMESVFKRATVIKNSGTQFLGEGLGGFLDKYDSMGFTILALIAFNSIVDFEYWLVPPQ